MGVPLQRGTRTPIMAILTMDDKERRFRGNHKNFLDLVKAGHEKNVVVYVVTCSDLNLNAARIRGYVYDFTKQEWKEQMMPLPHVVYNRIPLRKDESRPEVQKVIEDCLTHPGIDLFNPFFFNKWSLFEWLNKAKATRKYIPKTCKLSSQKDLERLLERHHLLYLKPERGKAGKGIMRIEQVRHKKGSHLSAKGIRLTIQEKKKSESHMFSNMPEVWKQVEDYMDAQEYIAQQGIQLKNYRNRPFDLRILVQKGRQGKWSISGVGARIAGKSSITTHVPRGGSIDDPEKLLAASFGKARARVMLRRVHLAALAIARRIENRSRHTLGEMSIDLGVDETGKLWFFEANSKPMKFDEPSIREKSLTRIILYAKHLAKKRSAATKMIFFD